MDKKDKVIILINPPSLNIIPIGLYLIAAVLKENGFKVVIIDGGTENVYKKLARYKDRILLCGITACTDTVASAYRVVEHIKNQISQDIICVIGGPHTSALPEQTLAESLFDIAVEREGEMTCLEISQKIADGVFPTGAAGCYEKTESGITYNGLREYIKDLDGLPLPAYDLVDMRKQFHFIRLPRENHSRIMPMMLTRGCAFDCPFCSSKKIWNKRLRRYSVDYSINFIKQLLNTYQLKGITFLDDDFFISKKWTLEFLEKFTKAGLHKKMIWSCQIRSNSATPAMLEMAKKAGCVLIRIGIESGSDTTLGFLKENTTTVQANFDAVSRCNETGLTVMGTMIIGSPDETLTDILDTISFIEKSGLDNVEVFIATPYPGTRLHSICQERGYLKEGLKWTDFETYRPDEITKFPVSRSKYFSKKQLFMMNEYIRINAVRYVQDGNKVPKRNFKEELEQVLAGNYSSLHIPLSERLLSLARLIKLRYFHRAIANPGKAIQAVFSLLRIQRY